MNIRSNRHNGLYGLAVSSLYVLNALIFTLIFEFVWYQLIAVQFDEGGVFFRRGNLAILVLYLILYVSFAQTYDVFQVDLSRISELIGSEVLACFMSGFFTYIVCIFIFRHFPNVLPFLLMLGLDIGFAILWAVGSHRWYFDHFPPAKSIVVWDDRQGLDELISSYGLDIRFEIVKDYSIEDCLKNLQALDQAETAFLLGVHSHERNIIIKYCVAHGIHVYMLPRIGDLIMSSAKSIHLFHLPFLTLSRYNPPIYYVVFKRFFDIVLSVILLVLTSPIFLVTAIRIHAYDGGEVLYRQCRMTKDGKLFDVLKFRSMREDAEKDGVARLSTGDKDDRITPVGRQIRATRIDELPQLLNILKGDMSLVGPRPERPEIAAEYEESLPEFALRLQAKCGLTGYAQVYGKYNTTPYDKLQMDLMYLANPSLAEDAKIIFATVKILFLKESTEGVAEGQTTASFQKPERSVKEETDVQTQHIAEEAEQKHNI